MLYLKHQIKNHFFGNYNHFFAILILSIYPITYFIGTGAVNLFLILIDIFLIFEIIKKKNYSFFHNPIFYYLLGLWFILLLNLLFSVNPENSVGRSVGFLRYIFFVMAIIYYLNVHRKIYRKIILRSWTIIFLIVCFDLLYEFLIGQNILGFTSYIPGRLASFFNDELRIGHFYYGFSAIILSFLLSSENKNQIKYFKNKKNMVFLFAFVFILISFLIGERSNFIKTFTMIVLFIFFIKLTFDKKKILFFVSLILIILFTINYSKGYKTRFLNQLFIPFFENPIAYISSTNYGDHYKFGLKIFLDNKLFGIGLKNYRLVVSDYHGEDGISDVNSSIHPHQTHIEILSELGIIGYSAFLLFFILSFINYRKNLDDNDKYYKLAGLLFIISYFIPLLPSGSFFTSHAATLFWMNFGFMILSQKDVKI